jgi:hypothetical protein
MTENKALRLQSLLYGLGYPEREVRMLLAAEDMAKALEAVLKEAAAANEAIRLNRDGSGSGRVKVATAMHRIACIAETALAKGQPA